MSRIGFKPIEIPKDVKVDIKNDVVTVQGKNGSLTQELKSGIHVELVEKDDKKELVFNRPSDSISHKSYHGLYRSLVNNMIEGVTNGFKKELEIRGVGYKAEMSGKNLILRLGFSHPVEYIPPEGIKIETPSDTEITVTGADKQLVGEVAAEIRSYREPEPYKGKGIRYKGEYVRRKAGKIGTTTV